MARRGREEWRKTVFRYKGLNGNVAVLLLYLADHMRADLTVSVPRTRIAEDLNINVRRVTERIKAAHDAGLLDTIVHGRERITAVYKATFPNPEVRTGGHLGGAVIRTFHGALGGADGGPTMKQVSPREVSSPEVGSSFTGETSFAPTQDVENSQCPVGEAGNEIARNCGPTTVGREIDGSTIVDRETHKLLLSAVQRAARSDGFDDAEDELFDLLGIVYGEEIAGYGEDYWRTVPKKASNRYEAGKWLRKFLNTARLNC